MRPTPVLCPVTVADGRLGEIRKCFSVLTVVNLWYGHQLEHAQAGPHQEQGPQELPGAARSPRSSQWNCHHSIFVYHLSSAQPDGPLSASVAMQDVPPTSIADLSQIKASPNRDRECKATEVLFDSSVESDKVRSVVDNAIKTTTRYYCWSFAMRVPIIRSRTSQSYVSGGRKAVVEIRSVIHCRIASGSRRVVG